MSEKESRLEAFKKEVLKEAKVVKDMGLKVEVSGGVLDFERYEMCYRRSQKRILTIAAGKVFALDMPQEGKIKVLEMIGDLISNISNE
jgi:hypothetical protein